MQWKKRFLWILAPLLILVTISVTVLAQWQTTPVWTVKVVASYPHDANAFTQGLVVEKGQMYEGTGQKGASTLRKVDYLTGKVLASEALKPQYFGEGITILDGKIYQLTWTDHVGIIYDLETMKQEGVFKYAGEGWGITTDGKLLILSDGSNTIRFLDPQNAKEDPRTREKTFREVRKITVREAKRNRIKNLNELEFVQGEIWANIWYEDRVARISPEDGSVLGWIDMRNLIPQVNRDKEAVLNGIAYDAEANKIFVTGKNWPKLFEIQIQK